MVSNINIDYDRGVIKRSHPDGLDVYMYKDEPGVYRNAYGTVVSEELAKKAGFDTQALGKQRMFAERLAHSKQLIAEELAMGEQKAKVVVEKDGFQIVDIGMDRHWVQDPDGNKLTQNPLPLKAAKALLEGLSPDIPSPQKTKGDDDMTDGNYKRGQPSPDQQNPDYRVPDQEKKKDPAEDGDNRNPGVPVGKNAPSGAVNKGVGKKK